jgi:hypothetical protein
VGDFLGERLGVLFLLVKHFSECSVLGGKLIPRDAQLQLQVCEEEAGLSSRAASSQAQHAASLNTHVCTPSSVPLL